MTNRRSRGHAIAEFAPALTILVFGFVLPLLDLAFIPIRYLTAYAIIDHKVHQLALANRGSDAQRMLETESSWTISLANFGSPVKKTMLAMVVTDPSSEQHRFEVGQAGSIPAELLPNAKNSLRTYRLEIIADLEISPLLTLRGVAVPGLTAPAPVTIRAAAHWENLGRDPNTREYYVNE